MSAPLSFNTTTYSYGRTALRSCQPPLLWLSPRVTRSLVALPVYDSLPSVSGISPAYVVVLNCTNERAHIHSRHIARDYWNADTCTQDTF